ncbi:MAG: hypothetical protein KDJ65_28965 [Anaerolineae bacterium]|nr:hypothetical protein [Anaerolineae bacterium]
MSIRNLRPVKPTIPSDLAQTLGIKGVQIILILIRDAYSDLLSLQCITSGMDENDITEEWFVCLQLHWRKTDISLVPIHEKGDKTNQKSKRGKPPTVDCCFRHQWHKHSYFGIECKLIEANNKILCDKYITNGVDRFLDCRYSSNCSQGAVLGYIRQTICLDVATNIEERLTQLSGNPSLNKTQQLLPFEEHYTSVHHRTACISPFTLHHFLLSFN